MASPESPTSRYYSTNLVDWLPYDNALIGNQRPVATGGADGRRPLKFFRVQSAFIEALRCQTWQGRAFQREPSLFQTSGGHHLGTQSSDVPPSQPRRVDSAGARS